MLGTVYLLSGQPNSGKTVLGKRLFDLLSMERRNWRKSVFSIDENTFNGTLQDIEKISKYIHDSECDVVVMARYPRVCDRNRFKDRIGRSNFRDIYLHCTVPKRITYTISDYEEPSEDDSIWICTNRVNVDIAYNDIVTKLTGYQN